jgi:hypothetical protein
VKTCIVSIASFIGVPFAVYGNFLLWFFPSDSNGLVFYAPSVSLVVTAIKISNLLNVLVVHPISIVGWKQLMFPTNKDPPNILPKPLSNTSARELHSVSSVNISPEHYEQILK